MAYKDLHVHVDNDDVCSKRLHAAADLATRLDAHLTGVYVRRSFPFPVYAEVPMSASVVENYNNILNSRESSAQEKFEQVIKEYQLTIGTDWRALEGSVDITLSNEARYSDMLILGQADPDDELQRNRGLADLVVLRAGRPCLIIPYIGVQPGFGKEPLIAWDGSRESSRAIHDAMPLLEQANKVTVLIAEQPGKSGVGADELPGSMISQHLARHRINVEVKVLYVKDIHTSDAILSYIADNGNDLLVMGAYGHSRLREVVLGGVTREIMTHMTIPVFMSH